VNLRHLAPLPPSVPGKSVSYQCSTVSKNHAETHPRACNYKNVLSDYRYASTRQSHDDTWRSLVGPPSYLRHLAPPPSPQTRVRSIIIIIIVVAVARSSKNCEHRFGRVRWFSFLEHIQSVRSATKWFEM